MRNLKIRDAPSPVAYPASATALQLYAERQQAARRELKRLFPEIAEVANVIRRTQKGHTLVLSRSVLDLRYVITISDDRRSESLIHVEPGIKTPNRERALLAMVDIITKINTTNWTPPRITDER